MRKNFTKSKACLLLLLLLGAYGLQAQPCPSPTNVTATPSVLCAGGTTQLNATSGGNTINWYTQPSGGISLGSSLSGSNFTATPAGTTTYYSEALGVANGIQTFSYTGGTQSFTVPIGVTSITVDAYGAQGGSGGGLGGRVQATLVVTPGQALQVRVGGQGGNSALGVVTGGYNGGGSSGSCGPQYCGSGGGGASDVRTGAFALADRLVVAGGGGGSHPINGPSNAGAGGGLTGGAATSTGNGCIQLYATGGTQAAGGNPSTSTGACCTGTAVPGGTLGQGGNGVGPTTNCNGGDSGSGGGGGYYGGGGGFTYSSGGGGSSYTMPGATSVTHTQGQRAGNGQVVITWLGTACTASQRTPVTVTVDNVPPVALCTPITVNLDPQGDGSTTAAAVDNGSTDDCAIASITLNQTGFTCADAGQTSVTLTVTDNNGNTSTCAAAVTVNAPQLFITAGADTTTCGFNVSCSNGADGIAQASGSGGCPGYTYLWSNGTQTSIATSLAAGTYTVTVTDASGGTAVSTVVLTAPSALQTTALIDSTCAGISGGSIALTTTGGNTCQGGSYTYLWSNGATTATITGLPVGPYGVTITDAANCTETQTYSVPSFAAPIPTFTQAGNQLTSNQTWSSYQWLMNGTAIPGATSMTYVLTQTANYSLQVTNAEGCTGTSATTSIVGVSDVMGNWADLSIFPNPASGEFRLRTASPIGYGITVTIHDLFGSRLFAKALPELGREAAFNIKDFAAGTYMVEVTSEAGQRKLFKLVVQ